MQRIQLFKRDFWGHRKDINEYFTISAFLIEKIKDMKTEGRPVEEIEKKISRESELNPEMVGYILKGK